MSDVRDLFVGTEGACIRCKHKLNTSSKLAQRWHALIRRHKPYFFTTATIRMTGFWDQADEVEYEIKTTGALK